MSLSPPSPKFTRRAGLLADLSDYDNIKDGYHYVDNNTGNTPENLYSGDYGIAEITRVVGASASVAYMVQRLTLIQGSGVATNIFERIIRYASGSWTAQPWQGVRKSWSGLTLVDFYKPGGCFCFYRRTGGIVEVFGQVAANNPTTGIRIGNLTNNAYWVPIVALSFPAVIWNNAGGVMVGPTLVTVNTAGQIDVGGGGFSADHYVIFSLRYTPGY